MKVEQYNGPSLGDMPRNIPADERGKWLVVNLEQDLATLFPCKTWAWKFLCSILGEMGENMPKGKSIDLNSLGLEIISAKEFKEKYPNLNS